MYSNLSLRKVVYVACIPCGEFPEAREIISYAYDIIGLDASVLGGH